ncbi:cell division protein ZapB [Neptunomonas antarctica]|uniref:Cell division protein ZapB n=1 Tax=Neptunomonas antarctica TaxID=619304 RepID=A0A1N7J8S9_9GAMM|nr:cell division protein ZapB [Neptunomonas antarctica]SIS45755.1 cell division protein ZapB [Neptunomonas antarctica]
MQTELFNQLEAKIESMIDEVELLRMEINELREAKQKLEDGQQVWQENLQHLLNKFDSVDAAE